MDDPDRAQQPLAVLVAQHRRFLDFLERRTGDRAVAEDLLQDAFVRGIQKIDSVRDDDSVVAWFFRVLRNALAERGRRAAAETRAMDQRARQSEAADDADLERAVCACVSGLVPLLTPEQAELIRRVDLAGESSHDVVGADTAPGTARVRLHRARAALRREVERTCRTCAEHGCLDCSCRSAGGE